MLQTRNFETVSLPGEAVFYWLRHLNLPPGMGIPTGGMNIPGITDQGFLSCTTFPFVPPRRWFIAST